MDAKINKKYTKGGNLDVNAIKKIVQESESDPTVGDWAKNNTPPTLSDLNAVGDEYTETPAGTMNVVSLNNCEFPTSVHTLSELSDGQVEFIRYIVDKVINNNVEELKLKGIFLADGTYYTPISVICSTYSQGSGMTIYVTGYQGDQFTPDVGPDYITTLSIQAQVNNQELIDAAVIVKRVPARVAIEDVNTNTKTIKPNVFYRWTTPQTSLSITLEAPENVTIANEYMFEFVSGSTPTTLSITPNTIKWPDAPTIEANKIYQVSILNGIGLIISVDNE